MPELPEVETISLLLAPLVRGRTILSVRRLDPRIARVAGAAGPEGGLARRRGAALLVGRRIGRVTRRGKALILSLSPPGALVFRLGMTGRLDLAPGGSSLAKPHLHAVFGLSGGGVLLYTDPRRFGRVLVDPSRSDPELGLAPDPFSRDFTWEGLAERGGRSGRAVKDILMDQSVVSGIGNIYAAEILHRAGISPSRRGKGTRRGEWKRIAGEAGRVLAEAIGEGGSTVRDFLDPSGRAGRYQEAHLVYGRAGEICRRCGARIVRTLQGGRSTFFCPGCQK